VTPYYQTPGHAITVYHCRWEDLRDAGLLADVAFIWADPPYGMSYAADKKRTRGKDAIQTRNTKTFARVICDDKPYDPAPLLALDVPTILWGANHYASRLPDSPSWLYWDKREDTGSDCGSDGELAWTNLGGPQRTFSHLWRGLVRKGTRHCHATLHPTEKPPELSTWAFVHAMGRKKLKPGDLVLAPYMGSGPEIDSARKCGLRMIACDVEELYCGTAVSARLGAMPAPEPLDRLGPLFGGGP